MPYSVYEGSGLIGTGTDYSVDVPYPLTINANDILIATLLDADNDTFDTPSGWTKILEDGSNSNASVAIYWMRAVGTESGVETFTSILNSGSLVAGIMHRYSGCTTSGDPISDSFINGVSQATAHSMNSGNITVLSEECTVVGFAIVEDNTINSFTNGGGAFVEDSREETSVGSDAHFGAASGDFADGVTTWTGSLLWGYSSTEYACLIGLVLISATASVITDVGINIGNSWKLMAGAKINIGGVWKTVTAIKQNIGGVWKDVL